ncbi:class D sortase [Lawsonibacter sp. JLR.KK007]|jgi:sortase A|uniref:class D sortase n=1 Tax=Lawsonibacter sp. JLR.KK007 TaxID=3114293 RepID=UPI002FEF7325
MKKRLTMLLALCCLLGAFATPASALEYTFDSPPTGDFGAPTSDDTIYEHKDPNVDRSKSSALIPPGFGTPTSYLPNSGEYLTPNLAAGGPLNSPSLNGTVTGSIGGGTVLLPGAVDAPTSSYPTTGSTANTQVTGFTDVTSDLYYSNGSLGTLKIPAIGLTVKVVQGTDSKALAKGAGHFTNTSIWDGNCCLAGHNRGVTNHFGKIHTLDTGDTITLTTKLGTRTYSVTSVMKVGETDNSMLAATTENCITLFTCVRDERDYRWCVRAVEV